MSPGVTRWITNRLFFWWRFTQHKNNPTNECLYAGLRFLSKGHVPKLIQACEAEQVKNMIAIPPKHHHPGVVMDFVQVSSLSGRCSRRVFQPILRQRTWAQDTLIDTNQHWIPAALRKEWPENEPIERKPPKNDKINKLHWCNTAPTWVL